MITLNFKTAVNLLAATYGPLEQYFSLGFGGINTIRLMDPN